MKNFYQAGLVLFLSFGLLGSAKVLTPGEAIWQDGVAYRLEGKQMQEAGDLQRASTAYRKAIMVYPVYAEAYNDLGVVLESMGDLAGAEEAYLTALKLKPKLVSAHSNLALFYEERGKIKEASEHWAARVRVGAPDDPWVIKARQKLLQYSLPVPESAEGPVSKQADKARQAVQAGQAHMEAKRWSEAVREFERALVLDPTNKTADRLLGVALSQMKRDEGDTARELESSRVRVLKESEAVRKTMQAHQEKKIVVQETKPVVKKTEVVVPPVAAQAPVVAPAPVAAPQDAIALAQEYAREKTKTRSKTVKELLGRAVTAMREGSYREAVNQYGQVLLLDPENRDAKQGLERAKRALANQEETQAASGY